MIRVMTKNGKNDVTKKIRTKSTQGKYVPQDSTGMRHLMPWRHLPDWREEDEQAFVHCGS